MNLPRAIHQRWAVDHVLSGMVPATRLLVGAALGDPARPYVVLLERASMPLVRTSKGTAVDRQEITFQIRADRLEAAQRIVGQIARCFDRQAFDIDAGRALDMRHLSTAPTLHETGVWQVEMTFQVTLLAAGRTL